MAYTHIGNLDTLPATTSTCMPAHELTTQNESTDSKFYLPAQASQDVVRALRALLPPRPRTRP